MYSPSLATIWIRPQYVLSIRSVLEPTPYPARMLRHLSLSRALCTFCRSRNTSWSTASFMAVSCWGSLASRVVVSISRPDQNPCSVSWYQISKVSLQLMMLMMVLHKTSMRQIPLKSFLYPFVINTTVCHVPSYLRVQSRNYACTSATIFLQLV